jgi:hypothetical protein
MAFLPFAPVNPPVPQAERYRLLTVANGPIEVGPDGQPIRIYGGVTYEPTYCGETHDYPVVCGPDESPGESPGTFDKVFDPLGDLVTADPFVVYATLECGGAGHADMPAWMREKTLQRFATGEATGVSRLRRILAASSAPTHPTDPTSIVWCWPRWNSGCTACRTSCQHRPDRGHRLQLPGLRTRTPRGRVRRGRT